MNEGHRPLSNVPPSACFSALQPSVSNGRDNRGLPMYVQLASPANDMSVVHDVPYSHSPSDAQVNAPPV